MTFDVDGLTGKWDHRELPPNIRVGRGVFLEDRTAFANFKSEQDPALVIGDRVRAYTWTRFSLEPTGVLEIGDDCILVGAMFMCAGRITLGRRVLVSFGVTIADADFHPH